MDRLQRGLMAIDNRFVVLGTLPGGCWMPLPRGWRQMRQLHGACDPRPELIPLLAEWPGEIGIHPILARALLSVIIKII
jgi:hypothetical protein